MEINSETAFSTVITKRESVEHCSSVFLVSPESSKIFYATK